MRTLKELLILLRDSLINNTDQSQDYSRGICGHTRKLWFNGIISAQEHKHLRDYVNMQRPTRSNHKEFRDPGRANHLVYWWPLILVDEKYREVRVKFIEKLINDL